MAAPPGEELYREQGGGIEGRRQTVPPTRVRRGQGGAGL